MFGRSADLGLVTKHFLGEAGLSDPRQLNRALDIGQLLDRRVASDKGVDRQARRHSKRLARDKAVKALARFGCGRRSS